MLFIFGAPIRKSPLEYDRLVPTSGLLCSAVPPRVDAFLCYEVGSRFFFFFPGPVYLATLFFLALRYAQSQNFLSLCDEVDPTPFSTRVPVDRALVVAQVVTFFLLLFLMSDGDLFSLSPHPLVSPVMSRRVSLVDILSLTRRKLLICFQEWPSSLSCKSKLSPFFDVSC